jgi:fructokinase
MSLVVLGAVLWDLFDEEKHIGGAPFNAAVHARKLGMDAALISAVGDDDLGREALARAAELGLDTRLVRTVKDLPTGTVQVFLKDGQPDYTIHRPAAYDAPALSDEDLRRLAAGGAEWLYFGTLEQMNPTVRGVLNRLMEALPDARRFYDVNLRKESYTPELVKELLAETTFLKANEEEVEVLAGTCGIPGDDAEAFCRALAARFDLEAICVTRGENGCAIWRKDAFVESPGCRIAVADAVGAGDAFSAALMYGVSNGWPLERVADFANRLGGLVASRNGAVPEWTLAEVTKETT